MAQQPYVSWKGPATNSLVPTHAYPDTTDKASNGPNFKARPIKHWRKQLLPNNKFNGTPRPAIGMPMDKPGGSVYLGNTPANTTCLLYNTTTTAYANGIKNNVEKYNNTNFAATTLPSDNILNTDPGAVNCVACNPEANIIRRATTVLSKNYYTNTKEYLRSRCVLYDQKLSANKVRGIQYVGSNGQPLYPTNSPTGPQVRLTDSCGAGCQAGPVPVVTIHKPNNLPFYTQGAVDSSTRLDRLKVVTITNNAASFGNRFGRVAVAATRYSGESVTPYFVKSKYKN
jgi:hypothetical protein